MASTATGLPATTFNAVNTCSSVQPLKDKGDPIFQILSKFRRE